MSNRVQLIVPRKYSDARGWFMETYSRADAFAKGVDVEFVQDNQSYSASKGTIRGLHFQSPPHAQAKLVRCVRGAIMDFAVDIRNGSPTYGQWVGAKLSADGGEQLYIPAGFAHGFLTLEDNTEVSYKVTSSYNAESDGGIFWADPSIGIDWQLGNPPILSDKDSHLPKLSDFTSPFEYDGQPLEQLRNRN